MLEVNHQLMSPPSLRIVKSVEGEKGDLVSIWDLRITQPNVSHMAMNAVHSLEHFMGSLLPEISKTVVNFAPMGCQTGFYITTLNMNEFDVMADYLTEVFTQVGCATEVPLANNEQCGWAENHSLLGAQEVASWILRRRSDWQVITVDQKS